MTHVMVKGMNVPLDVPGVRAVLRWTPGPGTPDVDASVLLLGRDGRVRSDADFVFYNEPRHPSGLARHLPKKRGPQGLTDTVEVDLAALDPTVDRVVVAASCDGGPFRLVQGLTLTLHDTSAPPHAAPLVTFEVAPETGQETALNCGELYRRGAGWKFRALGEGYASGLVGLATEFGIAVDDVDADDDSADGRTATGQPATAPAAPAEAATATAPMTGPMTTPMTGPMTTPMTTPMTGPMAVPTAEPTSAYGYPLQAPGPAHVPAQPAYGYPQPVAAPPVHQQLQPDGYPAYGYPQPVSAVPAPPPMPPAPPAPAFALPPQGPQFQSAR